MTNLAARYEKKPHQWNLAIMFTAGAVLWSMLAFYIGAGLDGHSVSETAHPAITGQLQEIRSGQLRSQILAMDKLICEQPSNNYYRAELLKLITAWESLTNQKFPTQLLRCANGNP